MKKKISKILSIVLCMLLFTTIIPVAYATDILKVETTDLEVSSTSDVTFYAFIRGRITNLNRDGNSLSFTSVRLHVFAYDSFSFVHGQSVDQEILIDRPFVGFATNNFIIGFYKGSYWVPY